MQVSLKTCVQSSPRQSENLDIMSNTDKHFERIRAICQILQQLEEEDIYVLTGRDPEKVEAITEA